MSTDEKYEYLIDNGLATEAEMQLISGVMGYKDETMEGVLYYRTGYEDFEQLIDEGNDND